MALAHERGLLVPLLPGGHFFNREHKDLFFAELGSILGAVEK